VLHQICFRFTQSSLSVVEQSFAAFPLAEASADAKRSCAGFSEDISTAEVTGDQPSIRLVRPLASIATFNDYLYMIGTHGLNRLIEDYRLFWCHYEEIFSTSLNFALRS
jgi:hypothetical protein